MSHKREIIWHITLIRRSTTRTAFTFKCCCIRPLYGKESRWTRHKYSIYWLSTASHHKTCPFHQFAERKQILGFNYAFCAYIMNISLRATISIVTGAGGLSISPRLSFRNTVPYDSPAFKLLRQLRISNPDHIGSSTMSRFLETTLRQLYQLFSDGKASPHDETKYGETLLHVS